MLIHKVNHLELTKIHLINLTLIIIVKFEKKCHEEIQNKQFERKGSRHKLITLLRHGGKSS